MHLISCATMRSPRGGNHGLVVVDALGKRIDDGGAGRRVDHARTVRGNLGSVRRVVLRGGGACGRELRSWLLRPAASDYPGANRRQSQENRVCPLARSKAPAHRAPQTTSAAAAVRGAARLLAAGAAVAWRFGGASSSSARPSVDLPIQKMTRGAFWNWCRRLRDGIAAVCA